MGVLKSLRKLRRTCYQAGRVLGDVTAVCSGNPFKIGKRVINKWTGRHVTRHFYFGRGDRGGLGGRGGRSGLGGGGGRLGGA